MADRSLQWYFKLGGNYDAYLDECYSYLPACPILLLEYWLREVICDPVACLDNKPQYLGLLIFLLVLFVLMMFACKILRRRRANNLASDVSDWRPISLEELTMTLHILKYEMDTCTYCWLDNLLTRVSNATQELTHMRCMVLKFIGLTDRYEPRKTDIAIDSATIVKTCNSNPTNTPYKKFQVKYKLGVEAVLSSTKDLLQRMKECNEVITKMTTASRSKRNWCKQLMSHIYHCYQKYLTKQTKDIEAGKLHSLSEARNVVKSYISGTVRLIDDWRFCEYRCAHNDKDIKTMACDNVPLSKKLKVVIRILIEWSKTLKRKLSLAEELHKDNELCLPVLRALNRTGKLMHDEYNDLLLLWRILKDVETTTPNYMCKLSNKVIKSAFNKSVQIIAGREQHFSMNVRRIHNHDRPFLHRLACLRNHSAKIKCLSTQTLHKQRNYSCDNLKPNKPNSMKDVGVEYLTLANENKNNKLKTILHYLHYTQSTNVKLLSGADADDEQTMTDKRIDTFNEKQRQPNLHKYEDKLNKLKTVQTWLINSKLDTKLKTKCRVAKNEKNIAKNGSGDEKNSSLIK